MNQALLVIGLKISLRLILKRKVATLMQPNRSRGFINMPSRLSRSSRRLVIDASVAQSSGDEYATYPTSKHCRDFLLAVLEIYYCAVMTAEIREEWNRHQSSFARRWRLSMVARRKLYAVDVALNDELREKIGRAASRDKDAEAMLKDTH